MKDIEIIRKSFMNCVFDGVSVRDSATEALNRIETLLKEAPKFFSSHDFDGEKLNWLERAELIDYNDRDPDEGNLGTIIRS